MATSADPRPRRQLFLVLSAIAVLTLAVIAVLTFRTRATLVELELTVSSVELTVVPPATARTQTGLLAPEILLQKLYVREADSLGAVLEDRGSTVLHPHEGGSIQLAAGRPLEMELRLFRPTRVTVAPAGRSGGAVVKLTLEGTGAEGWSAAVPAEEGMHLELRDVEGENLAVDEDSPDLDLRGGTRQSEIGLFLPPRRGPATLLRVVDLATGEEAPPRSLSFASTELRALASGNRLALLEPQPGEAASETLLHPNLKVRDLQLFQPDPVEPTSYIENGRIRFPGGERATVELEPGALLSLAADDPLILRSCALEAGRLELAVSGKATRLEMSLTPDQRAELLPNLFQWFYTHELRKLIYGILASVLGTSLALLKLFGLFKE
jgi:hypothetical protein